jgi:hypothetical protein
MRATMTTTNVAEDVAGGMMTAHGTTTVVIAIMTEVRATTTERTVVSHAITNAVMTIDGTEH